MNGIHFPDTTLGARNIMRLTKALLRFVKSESILYMEWNLLTLLSPLTALVKQKSNMVKNCR
jgi:hypothetical protein